MRVVDKPAFRPQHCAAIPFIGPASHPEERWVDTECELDGFDNHVYLSATAIHEAAVALGIPTSDDLAIVEAERDLALRELGEALEELAALRPMKALIEQVRKMPVKLSR